MAKINCVDLKEETSPKEKSLLNVEPCLKVEELLKSYKLESLEKFACNFDSMKDQCCVLSAMISFAITGLKLSRAETEQMLYHLEFCNLAGHSVTENDFQVLYHHSSIDFHDKNTLWEHNKRCLVFFVKGFSGMVRSIDVCKEIGTSDDIVVNVAKELQERIFRHHEIRTYFDFCAECEHNTTDKCRFWEKVSQSLQQILCTLTGDERAIETRKYLRGLDVPCKIPKTIEALKQRGGI